MLNLHPFQFSMQPQDINFNLHLIYLWYNSSCLSDCPKANIYNVAKIGIFLWSTDAEIVADGVANGVADGSANLLVPSESVQCNRSLA